MTLAAPSSSGRPWLSKDVWRGGTGYKGSFGLLRFSALVSLRTLGLLGDSGCIGL